MRTLLTLLFLAAFLPAKAQPGGPFDYPNCYIRYTYDATGLRTQRYYYCPGTGPEDPGPPGGSSTSSSTDEGAMAPRPAPVDAASNPGHTAKPEVLITSIYPNPTRDKCTIVLSEPLNKVQVIVYDIKGTVMLREEKSGQQFELQLSRLVPGQYFIAVFTPLGRLVFEITKL